MATFLQIAALGGAAYGLYKLLASTPKPRRKKTNGSTNGGSEGPGGYGQAPPSPPPEEARPSPVAPGTGQPPKAKPAGNDILPAAPPLPSANPALSGQPDLVGLSWPSNPTSDIQGQVIEEYERGVLVLFVPQTTEEVAQSKKLLDLENLIGRWAFLYGYPTVAIVHGTPTSNAYTAQAWNQGQAIGSYSLGDSYTPGYMQALPASALPEAFAAGVIEWIYGPKAASENYVGGSPSYSWPRQDLFPNEQAFEQWLSFTGYSVSGDGNVRSQTTRNSVRVLQEDYNIVANAVINNQGQQVTPAQVQVNDKIDDNTVLAMAAVSEDILPLFGQDTWQQVVGKARSGQV